MRKNIAKKAFSTMMALTLALSVSATAFADDTTIKQDTTDKTGTMSISHTVDPTYTVTIPESVTINGSATVSASDVVVAEGSVVNVTITATSAENGEDFTIASSEGSGEDTLTYTVKDAEETSYALGDTVLTVDPADSTEGSVDLTFALAAGETPLYSGTYSGTITFTVSVDEK